MYVCLCVYFLLYTRFQQTQHALAREMYIRNTCVMCFVRRPAVELRR